MKNRMKIGIALLSMIVLASVASAEQRGLYKFAEADKTPAMRIKYNGSASTATFTNSTTAFVVVDDTVTSTESRSAGTYANLASTVLAATNSAGKKNFEIEYVGAIAADVYSNNVIAATATVDLTDGKWHNIGLMDTSAIIAYPVGVPGSDVGNFYVDSIYGNLTGTGDITLDVYIDGAKVWENYIVSPTYSSSDGSIYLTNNIVSVNIELPSGIMASSGKPVAVRATRATTATTGNLGVIFTKR